jgi:electron transfer flavoprotein alpha subunit
MPELDPEEHDISELGPKIQGIEDIEELRTILAAEQEGEDRTGAKTVIESRIEKLEAEAEEDEEPDGLPDLSDMSTAEAANAIRDIDDPDDLQELLDIEAAGEDRSGVKTQIQNRLDSVTEAEEAEEGEAEAAETPEERHPHLDHPTADKRHVRAVEDGEYRDMWVYCETQQGELIDVSKEMLGKARQLMDDYNDDYDADEKVVAVVIGDDAEAQAQLAVEYGADVALYQEDERLGRFLDKPYTEIFCDAARGAGHPYGRDDRPEVEWHGYDEPRYVLFPATNNGRDLSATVQAELDSGLASDCSDLFIEDVLISNPAKTGEPGTKREFERVLHMKRPDFSGFEYSTILCLDKPDREFHPQGGSVIPGTFDLPEPESEREGEIVEWETPLDDDWFDVEVTDYDRLDEGVDLTGHEVVVAMGRGIGDDPSKGIELGLELVDAFEDAAFGLSRGVITASYQFEGHVEDYITEERQIGESGQVVEPPVYIAAGISGAVQHKVGMDEADTIISINTDTDADIVDFSDHFIEGDLFEVLPALTEALESGELDIGAVAADGGMTDD